MLLLECRKCQLVKAEDDFRRCLLATSGREGVCKTCRGVGNKKPRAVETKEEEKKADAADSKEEEKKPVKRKSKKLAGGDLKDRTNWIKSTVSQGKVKIRPKRCYSCGAEDGCQCDANFAGSKAFFNELKCIACEEGYHLLRGPNGLIFCDDCLYLIPAAEENYTKLINCPNCKSGRPEILFKDGLCRHCFEKKEHEERMAQFQKELGLKKPLWLKGGQVPPSTPTDDSSTGFSIEPIPEDLV